jgi:AraC-like DNA-binding protein
MKVVDFIAQFGHERGPGGIPSLPTHRNAGLEIVYVPHGHLVWQCQGQAEVVPPESVFFTLPWQEHGSMLDFEPGHEWFFVVIRLRMKNPSRAGAFAFPPCFNLDPATTKAISRRLSRSKRHTWAATPVLALLLPELIDELKTPTTFHADRVSQLCSQIVLELASLVGSGKQLPNAPANGGERIAALIGELDRDFAHTWRSDEMADRVGLRRTQFVELFHHYTGDTPRRFLHRLRIEKSRQMLRDTKKSITTVALDCGFSSSQHFANVFRRFTRVSASAFRKRIFMTGREAVAAVTIRSPV